MPVSETFTLRDDLPKEDPWKDDLLGFAPFAERLAKVIASLNVLNGYVIGLHGEWGSGKSTAINFVRAYLKRHNDEHEAEEEIDLIDFRPWIISGHQDLTAAFFKVLAESLIVEKPLKRKGKRALSLVRGATDQLIDAVATVALTVDPTAGVASRAAATVAKKSVTAAIDRFLDDPSLQAAYEKLKKALQDTGKRFLVIIDDLDRLQDDEIRSIMQMVKTVGRLPNVVYLLAYDRAIVWDALDGRLDRPGPRFAEKIVQQEIELPRPPKHALLTILNEEIKFLIEGSEDTLRWHYIVRDGLRRWVRHPRDVFRLANAVKFCWTALIGEIDPLDLLAMEGLRLFDEVAFNWVRWNRDFFFSEGRFLMAPDEVVEAAGGAMRERLSIESRDQTLSILSVLFPVRAKAIGGKSSASQEPYNEVLRRRGIGCEPGYDAYFSLYPSPDAPSKTGIDEIINQLNDEAFLAAALESFIEEKGGDGRPLIGDLLEELRIRFTGRNRAMPTPELLNVLLQIGAPIYSIDWIGSSLFDNPRRHFADLIREILDSWGPEKAGKQLIAAFDKPLSPIVTTDIFDDRGQELGAIPSRSPSPPVIGNDDLKALGRKLLPVMEQAAADGTLGQAPYFYAILRVWSYLAGAGKAKAWLEAGMDTSAEFLATATKGLVGISYSGVGRAYSVHDRPDKEFYDLDKLLAACRKHLAGDKLDEDQRNRVNAISQAVEKILRADAATQDAEASPDDHTAE